MEEAAVAERLEANRHGAEQAAPDPEQPDADGEQGTAEPAAADPAGLSHRVTVTVRNSISGKVIYGPEELSGMTTVRDLQHKVVQGFAMQVLHGARILPEDCELGRLRTEQTASSSSSSGEVPSLELGMHIEARRLLGVFRSAEEEDELREDDAAVLEELEATYMALAEVGSGTFAKVYKAMRIDDASQSLVAIKKLAIDADEGGIPAAAIREVALVKKLDHPNVAQIHHVYSTSFCLFLVFELLDMDLRKYMRTYGHFASPEPLQQAAAAVLQGAAALPRAADPPPGPEAAEHPGECGEHDAEARGLRAGAELLGADARLHAGGGDPLVPRARAAARLHDLRHLAGHLVDGVHHRGDGHRAHAVCGGLGDRHLVPHLPLAGHARGGGLE
eukprot:CAMPEP_0195071032 /NCGR_PEP_ID=MMETSP0448-20130528/14946_1 /TAXON_ID=66468 /ORGANISM="Heterocapsa triquestra, Strain CCMP 448" /LENGTH=389 /DNA_ID=CAMNT_0040102825 /DNA_START=80 /DNA_END=1245 /DNA_ORIENTATION=-